MRGRSSASPVLSGFGLKSASRQGAPRGNSIARLQKATTLARKKVVRAAAHRRVSGRTVRVMLLARVFDAPREVVFKAWTDAKLMARWWGPQGFTSPVCEVHARPGGAVRIHMQGPDGVVYPMKGVFHEIVAPERLVLTMSAFEESNGRPRLKAQCAVTLTERDGRTALSLRIVVVRSNPEVAAGLARTESWKQCLERLAIALGETAAAGDA